MQNVLCQYNLKNCAQKKSGPSSVHFGIVAGTLHHRHLEGGDSEDRDDDDYSEDQPLRIIFKARKIRQHPIDFSIRVLSKIYVLTNSS